MCFCPEFFAVTVRRKKNINGMSRKHQRCKTTTTTTTTTTSTTTTTTISTIVTTITTTITTATVKTIRKYTFFHPSKHIVLFNFKF